MVTLTEADLDKGRVGIELEMILRRDLFNARTPIGEEFLHVFSVNGFTKKIDDTIVIHTVSKDVYYEPLETNNQELQGAMWLDLLPRLTAILSWLKRRDLVWVDKNSRQVYATEEPPKSTMRSNLYQVELPRAKLPGNPSCGVHIHFHAEEWFDHFDHAMSFAELWNYAMGVFRDESHPARYHKGDESFTPAGDEYASFSPLRIPDPEQIDTSLRYWTSSAPQGDEKAKNAYIVSNFLKWISNHRWTALNLTKVDVRKDVEFRFMHGTLNIETIIHWFRLLVALIEASKAGDIRDFKQYLQTKEPGIYSDHIKRKNALANADTSRADVWNAPKVPSTRAIRRLLNVPDGESYGFSSIRP